MKAQHGKGQVIPGISTSPPQVDGISDHADAVTKAVDNAIDFDLPDHEGKAWRLAGHLARGPVLLVFYRGDW